MTSSAAQSRINGAKGGRPESATKRLSRRRINELHATQHTPVDVMCDNMIFWHQKVQTTTVHLEKFAEVANFEDADDRREFVGIMKTMLAAREHSQQCAVDMAPYCHPRLQAIAIQQNNTHVVQIEGGLPMMPGDAPTPFEAAVLNVVESVG